MNKTRKVEVFSEKGQKWIEIPFEILRRGDKFRMFEDTGEPVMDGNKNHIFIATSDPYLTEEGVYGIKIKVGKVE